MPRVLNQRKGGRPQGSVYVGRPSKWGNPFVVHSDQTQSGKRFPMSPEIAVASFRALLRKEGGWFPVPLPWPKGKIPACEPTTIEDVRRELRGKTLMCWCSTKPGVCCHADVLLELANEATP